MNDCLRGWGTAPDMVQSLSNSGNLLGTGALSTGLVTCMCGSGLGFCWSWGRLPLVCFTRRFDPCHARLEQLYKLRHQMHHAVRWWWAGVGVWNQEPECPQARWRSGVITSPRDYPAWWTCASPLISAWTAVFCLVTALQDLCVLKPFSKYGALNPSPCWLFLLDRSCVGCEIIWNHGRLFLWGVAKAAWQVW